MKSLPFCTRNKNDTEAPTNYLLYHKRTKSNFFLLVQFTLMGEGIAMAQALGLSEVLESDELVRQGIQFQRGDGVEKDKAKAVQLFRIASEKGHLSGS